MVRTASFGFPCGCWWNVFKTFSGRPRWEVSCEACVEQAASELIERLLPDRIC